ncbi:hypothetical protein QBZ16_004515 [Prototheca wickerhamii]|uniref:D-isomer specific 2-hydroxyacid dehydrogenase NAD-binding domain-containing protein n=1 Tax=Prototheca wickerhamii TaxID=3111 RepID=A0AAD9MGX6_PROWI|nr:hypothetical protein QBZ16_004515 [Prototheca wickerhamii]
MASEVLLAVVSSRGSVWTKELLKHVPDAQVWPDRVTDLDAVKFMIVMKQPEGLLEKCPNLVAVNGLGHGVDYITKEEGKLKPDVQILRVVDTLMAERMAYWNLWAIINCQRRCEEYLQAQRAHRWSHGEVEDLSSEDNADFRVGILGFGALGGELASVLRKNGYPVSAWARSKRDVEGVAFFAGKEQLPAFLKDLRVLVGLLPLTPETTGLVDKDLLAMLPRGAFFINAGRGQSHKTADLLEALDSDQLAGAVLDVFEEEPLAKDSPLWDHPKVRVFPHVSSWTPIAPGVQQTLENWEAIRQGRAVAPERVVKRHLGY